MDDPNNNNNQPMGTQEGVTPTKCAKCNKQSADGKCVPCNANEADCMCTPEETNPPAGGEENSAPVM